MKCLLYPCKIYKNTNLLLIKKTEKKKPNQTHIQAYGLAEDQQILIFFIKKKKIYVFGSFWHPPQVQLKGIEK
jgi:hypothetical protein